MRHPVTLTVILSSFLVAWCACALALDPTLDVSQYPHDAWRVQEDGFTRSRLTSIAQTPDGYLWLGTDQGLYRFDGALNILWQSPPGQQLPSNMIWSLMAAHDGTLWIGTNKGLASWKDGKLTHYEGLAKYYIFTILEDHQGTVWVGAIGTPMGRLCAIQAGNVRCYGEDGSFGTGVVGLYEDNLGNLWVGMMNGFWRWKPGPSEFFPMLDALNSIRTFVEDDAGRLLFTTRSGIKRLINGKVESYSLPGNLQQSGTMQMRRDRDGGLWLGTWNHGIIHVHGGRAETYLDGLTGVDVVALFEDREGDIWIVTSNGLNRFREPIYKALAPPVLIKQITADSKIYDASNGLRLPVHVRDVTIDYTALTLITPDKIHFRYKLEGQDPDWREVVNDRQVQYSNLAPRDYRFRVMASNNGGVWNQAGASLEFSIAPAYYQTIWFRLLCTFLFLTLLWSIYRLRILQMQRKFKIALDARVTERTRIARELHDTLLQNFHGLMFQFQAASNLMLRRPDEAKRSLDDAISETKKAIAESREAIQGLRSEPIAKGNLAELLMSTSRELADSIVNEHPPVFDLIEEGDRKTLSSTVSSDICRIALELVRNAYQHAQAQRIEVELRYGDSMFRLRIRDDGRGIDPKVLKDGGRSGHWGSRGLRERADRIGASLDLWSEPGGGTEVQLLVPAEIAYENPPDSYRAKLVRKVKSRV